MSQKLRVIGGKWRSRVIDFPQVDAIRPTPDRVRETLFNWLQGHIHGSRCLELFCGSGILSIEALSRGASHCTALDVSPAAVKALESHLRKLGASSADFECTTHDAHSWLSKNTDQRFDLIFLDPPFADDDLEALVQVTAKHLNQFGHIYVESPRPINTKALPIGLTIYRQKRAGAVHYALLQCSIEPS